MDIDATVGVLIQSAEGGEWSVLAGAILLTFVAVTRKVTQDRLDTVAASWVSASSSVVGAVGVALMAGAVWWHALILGGFAGPAAAGFWNLFGSLLPPVDE